MVGLVVLLNVVPGSVAKKTTASAPGTKPSVSATMHISTGVLGAIRQQMRARRWDGPETATVYETTLDRAEAASSRDLVPGTEPVLLFVFSGHFRMEPAVWPPPPGSRVPPPHGSHVTFIVSKATGDGLGGGISSWPVLTAGLGKAHVVALR